MKTLGEILQRTETINPLQSPEAVFDYIDVSSVSNATFTIEETQRLKGKDAPSRARKLVRANDVIFATIRPTLQRIAVVPDHLDQQVCSTGYFVLRTKPGVDHRFVFYSLFTEEFMGQMESLQKGASYPAVTDGDVRDQSIPVPSLSEQQRVVGLLDEAFEGIATAKAHAEKNLQNARALFESHLQSVFTHRGTGWVEKQLEQIGKTQTGSTPKSAETGNYGAVISFVKPADFNADGSLDYERGGLSEKGLAGARIVPAGSVLTEGFQRSVIHRSGQATLPIINKSKWSALPVWLPPTVAEQERIAAKFGALVAETQRLATFYTRKLAALEALKKSLLHQAFTGQL